MRKEIEKILVDIIKHEMDLPDNYDKTPRGDVIPCVIIYGQNIKLFNTDKLQIAVQTVSCHTFSNRIEYIENPNPNPDLNGKDAFLEVQDINQSRMMQIDAYSRNNDARDRFWEITAALNSTYAQQQMDLYNFKIGTITDCTNISGIDGGSDINRFTTTFNVLVHHQKIKPVDYYDKFETTLTGEHGQIADIKFPGNRTITN